MRKTIGTIALLVTGATVASCSEADKLKDAANDQCGLECKTIAETNGSVSGIAEIDAFYAAALNLNVQANSLQAEIHGTLGEMAAAIGAEVAGNASIDATATAIAARIDKLEIEGGLKVVFQPPQCEVSAEAQLQAAAKCDATVDPGKAEVVCKGECELSASAEVKCDAQADLKCTGTAPSFKCEGECQGACEMDGSAECSGECQGTCTVESEADCEGEFTATSGGAGTCKVNAGATCKGTCSGTCQLSAKATCEGQCKGECTYTPPMGGCTGGAKASCVAKGDVQATCKGTCKGEFEPPKVKAECQASAKANASFKAECTPPQVRVAYKLKASVMANASARAKLEAQLDAFGRAFAKLEAKRAKVKLVANAGVTLVADAKGALAAAISAAEKGSIRVKVGAVCAASASGELTSLLSGATGSLKTTGDAVAKVSAKVTG